MPSATLNLRVSPRRMLSAREAAEYCGVPVKRLTVDCGVAPIKMPSGSPKYDMRDLDGWIDGMKFGQSNRDDDIVDRLD